MRTMIATLLVIPCALLVDCTDDTAPTAPQQTPVAAISDGGHGGRDGFYFLPPLAPEPEYDGVFDPLRQPVVDICELATDGCDVIAAYTLASGPDSVTVKVDPLAERYSVDWHTDRFTLTDGATYRIRVLLEGRVVGYVDVVRIGTDLKSTATGEVIPLVDGHTLPIRFRIEVELRLNAVVPAQAPNSVPSGFYDESNISRRSPCITGPYLKDIVVIVFQREATQLERQQAVDHVNGEVIGGLRPKTLEGHYFVQLPTDTGQNVCDAVDYLRTLPYVAFAGHSVFAHYLYRRANEVYAIMAVDRPAHGLHSEPHASIFLTDHTEWPYTERQAS